MYISFSHQHMHVDSDKFPAVTKRSCNDTDHISTYLVWHTLSVFIWVVGASTMNMSLCFSSQSWKQCPLTKHSSELYATSNGNFEEHPSCGHIKALWEDQFTPLDVHPINFVPGSNFQVCRTQNAKSVYGAALRSTVDNLHNVLIGYKLQHKMVNVDITPHHVFYSWKTSTVVFIPLIELYCLLKY